MSTTPNVPDRSTVMEDLILKAVRGLVAPKFVESEDALLTFGDRYVVGIRPNPLNNDRFQVDFARTGPGGLFSRDSQTIVGFDSVESAVVYAKALQVRLGGF